MPLSREREREMFYLTTHSTHFIYGYMASDIWTILIVRKETRCRHIGYSYRLTARVLLYAPSHRQDNTYHGLCYTSRGALAGTRNSSMGPPHEGSIRRPTAPWANVLPLSYVPLLPLSHAFSLVGYLRFIVKQMLKDTSRVRIAKRWELLRKVGYLVVWLLILLYARHTSDPRLLWSGSGFSDKGGGGGMSKI